MFSKLLSLQSFGNTLDNSYTMDFILGITKPCTHLHPSIHLHPAPPSSIHLHPAHFNLHSAPSTSNQFISASAQLYATLSTIFETKYST